MAQDPIRLVQLSHPQYNRRVALVQDSLLILLNHVSSVYQLAQEAIGRNERINHLIHTRISNDSLDYAAVWEGRTQWKLLPSFDHPDDPMHCLVSGTGLTHKNSAMNRQSMHQSATEKPTDSLVIYQWGLEGGSPEQGTIGVQPEWFHKGNGSMLKGHGEPLHVPAFANDGGEEPEIAGVYVTDKDGTPYRIGFTTANEFSDHVMEKKNYLYLAPSKLRECAIGPELVITSAFETLTGTVSIFRNGEEYWSSPVHTGQQHMAHSLENLEYHHFKYPVHRLPFQAHVHFFGADAFSFGQKIQLENGDVMEIHWEEMGRPLRNPIRIVQEKEEMVTVQSLV